MLPPEFACVILSRRRWQTIGQNTLRLFPDAYVTVEESELPDYELVVPAERLLPHPLFDTVADIRNWINDQFPDRAFVVQLNDDMAHLRCLVGWRPRLIDDPLEVAQVVERTAICARDAGAYVFGFGNIQTTPHFRRMAPFKLTGYVRNLVGFVQGHGLSWDPIALGHFDADLGLQAMLEHRIIWRDERFAFVDARLASNSGGLAGIRTESWLAQGRLNLRRKWGDRYVRFARREALSGNSTTEATVLQVRRHDPRVRRN
jgi:hypothetical protein